MDGFAVVGTHHKTGSVWMSGVFKGIARNLGIKYLKVRRDWKGASPPEPPAVIFSSHSSFRQRAPWLLKHPASRIVHIIRDPRDIIISGMHYHRTAREGWLHQPNAAFDGLSYQQKLNSLQDDRARYLFEMDNSAKRTIAAICSWNYARPNSMECKFEDLMRDTDMAMFTRMIGHLGFRADQYEECKKVFWGRSVFGTAEYIRAGHVRSGALHRWKDVFDRPMAEAFVARFGNALIDLGYEPDNRWMEALPNSGGAGAAG